MVRQSAGILLYRIKEMALEFFLVHPGGPYFVRKDEGHWTIPKGEILENEDPLDAATREFFEETGHQVSGDLIALRPILQKGGKKVYCWATEDDLLPEHMVSNTFELEWPPKSGKLKTYPEIDKGEWFSFDQAKVKINERQISFLEEVKALKDL